MAPTETPAIVVLILIAIVVLYFVLRARKNHGIDRTQFIVIIQRAADGTGDISDYRKLVHNPILSDPELEAARGRLVHLDDKYERRRDESISDAHRKEIATIADDLRVSLSE